jgi:hypothetical protein
MFGRRDAKRIRFLPPARKGSMQKTLKIPPPDDDPVRAGSAVAASSPVRPGCALS